MPRTAGHGIMDIHGYRPEIVVPRMIEHYHRWYVLVLLGQDRYARVSQAGKLSNTTGIR